MRNEILQLCKRHDFIKNSELRYAGIDGEILPPNSKERYNRMIRDFAYSVYDYFEEYQRFDEIKATIKWGQERDYDLDEIMRAIDECYAQFDDDEFIAALDFLVLSKLHYMVEYVYFQLLKKFYTPEFAERLE